jgi:rare lipoprotein A
MFVIAGCSSNGDRYYPESWMPSIFPGTRRPPTRTENWKNFKVGQPYQVKGKWYYPKENKNYAAVGTASWYGSEFHNRRTANGEIFDRHALTAAHPTLPMPSIVRVTNLNNGRTIQVRVNDRGPFKSSRVIDLSEAAAEELGFRDQGTARVKIQYDPQATAGLFYDGSDPDAPSEPMQHVARHSKSPEFTTIDARLNEDFSTHYVQTGAYSTRDSATRVSRYLRQVGKVLVEEANFKGNTLYRVKVGPYATEREAGDVLDQVASMGFNDAVVVGKPR